MEDKKERLSKEQTEKIAGGTAQRHVYYCNHCEDTFATEEELKNHVENVHGIITCPMCRRPMKKHSVCEVCGYADPA